LITIGAISQLQIRTIMNPGTLPSLLLLLGFALATVPSGWSQTIDVHGQTAAWSLWNDNQLRPSQVGVRYIPALSGKKSLSANWQFDTELSVHAYGFQTFGRTYHTHDWQLKPYRLWLRLTKSQMELRIGLQKINFGSASLIRPLMWFDRIDVRDPLQLTDGVYGILWRCYFLNNANIWLWGLYGNEDLKGWEFLPGEKKHPEYGGRVQLPLTRGEIGFTSHWRNIDSQKSYLNFKSVPEQRWAIDVKWDLGIGCWFESALIHRHLPGFSFANQSMTTLGADYTLALGRGLYLLTEYVWLTSGEKMWPNDDTISFSAITARYPLGILDMVQLMYFYDWKNSNHYRFVNWSRTYDRWQFILMAYWNPQQFLLYQNMQNVAAFKGRGAQLMIVFNY
jgi:hypothetical protein